MLGNSRCMGNPELPPRFHCGSETALKTESIEKEIKDMSDIGDITSVFYLHKIDHFEAICHKIYPRGENRRS